ncbi:PepSY domain-containing protein [Pseudidiomarina insulisalsae]|uniref:PepSY domain-containing protein n=1 Tax=Pseudidiomarina insulisalsae TaxID=575789 RepID=A0A432YQQ1_9GAMM|nr:PepSY domain-containing protein [Pseudidiomarina insulisalsae]RUO63642.1 PepSY domain-containing protein [Pseudidiomarina insulisalsae]
MKVTMLATLIAATGLLTACSTAHETTQCTTAPQSEWLDQAEFQARLVNEGYQINEFKVTEGNCYEIYGMDADGNKVEIYYNPVDGSVVKSESH